MSGRSAAILLALALVAGRLALAPVSAAIAPDTDRVAHSAAAAFITATASVADQQASSTQSELRFDRITTADGLSFPIVRDIVQDRQGFMWFATDSGLNRYDGYEFTVYREKPGDSETIRFDDVSVIYQDSDGTLWIGGGGGLDRFDRATQTFTHVDTRGQVFCIYEDSAGTLWAGFWHGLYGYDRATNEIIHSEQPNPDASSDWSARTETSVVAIDQDRGGNLWIGTTAGLHLLDREAGIFTAFRHDPQDPASLGSDRITTLYVDRHDTIWIGTDRGLDRFERDSGVFRHFRHDPDDPGSLSDDSVLSILEDGDGSLWAGTMGGLDRWDGNQGRFDHHRHDPEDPGSLSAGAVLSLFEDRSGVFWVGTTDGINRSSRRENQFTHYREQWDARVEGSYSLDVSDLLQDPRPAILSDGTILALEEDSRGALWIGTLDGGLNRLDRQSGQLTVYRYDPADAGGLSDDMVPTVFEDHAGVVWIGTGSGWLERFDPGSGTFLHERNLGAEVSAIGEDLAGNLWIGTRGEGVYRLGSDRQVLEHHLQYWQDPDHWWRNGTLSSHIISTIERETTGTMWLGTLYGGVNLWGETKDRFTHLRHDPADSNSLSSDRVLSILHDPEHGLIWIGTGGGGLNRYSQATHTMRHYTAEDGLPGDTVGCIAADQDGSLWLATIQGLSRFDPVGETFRNYDRLDGVGVMGAGMAGRGSCLQSRTGELLFGGSDGLYVFRPERIKENLQPPPVVVTALNILGETAATDLSTDDDIRLPFEHNFVSFEFAALDYTLPAKNQYAYRMEGLDRDWVYAGTRHYAEYPDLQPGDYVFRVKGSNSDGVWNEEGVALRITIEPPIWQTWPFRVMVATALVLGTIGVYRQRVRGIEAQSSELERQVEARTREIRQLSAKAQELAVVEERQRLARDLHDAVSQTLFSASLIAEALPEIWQISAEEGQELLRKLRHLNRGALAEMRALLMELRPAALAEASMKDLLRQLGEAAGGREGFPVTVTVDERCTLPADVRITLYRIAQEALNNVVKHAMASQVDVTLSCTPQPGRVKLCIRDDGIGFDPQAVPQDHLGLGIMHERAESIGARIEIWSEPGSGTQVNVVWSAGEERIAHCGGGQDA